jgi:hypothetical protein
MKRLIPLAVALFMSTASSALPSLRPLADSGAWIPHCDCLNREQLYFARHF